MSNPIVEQMRQAILGSKDIKIEQVEVPEWDLPFPLYVKALTGREREEYFESIRRITGKGKNKDIDIITVESSAKLASRCMCLEDGTKIFTDADVPQLAEKSAKALERVVNVSARLNGLDDDAKDDVKNVSSGTQVSGSNSGLQAS
jgi:hypothetical protein